MGSTTALTETLPVITNLTTASIPSTESATHVTSVIFGTETPSLLTTYNETTVESTSSSSRSTHVLSETTETVSTSIERVTSKSEGFSESTEEAATTENAKAATYTYFPTAKTVEKEESTTLPIKELVTHTVVATTPANKGTITPEHYTSTEQQVTEKEKATSLESTPHPSTLKELMTVSANTENQTIKDSTQFLYPTTKRFETTDETVTQFSKIEISPSTEEFLNETETPATVKIVETTNGYISTQYFTVTPQEKIKPIESTVPVEGVMMPSKPISSDTTSENPKSEVAITTASMSEIPLTVKPLTTVATTEQTVDVKVSTVPSIVTTIPHPDFAEQPKNESLIHTDKIETSTKTVSGQSREGRITTLFTNIPILSTEKYETSAETQTFNEKKIYTTPITAQKDYTQSGTKHPATTPPTTTKLVPTEFVTEATNVPSVAPKITTFVVTIKQLDVTTQEGNEKQTTALPVSVTTANPQLESTYHRETIKFDTTTAPVLIKAETDKPTFTNTVELIESATPEATTYSLVSKKKPETQTTTSEAAQTGITSEEIPESTAEVTPGKTVVETTTSTTTSPFDSTYSSVPPVRTTENYDMPKTTYFEMLSTKKKIDEAQKAKTTTNIPLVTEMSTPREARLETVSTKSSIDTTMSELTTTGISPTKFVTGMSGKSTKIEEGAEYERTSTTTQSYAFEESTTMYPRTELKEIPETTLPSATAETPMRERKTETTERLVPETEPSVMMIETTVPSVVGITQQAGTFPTKFETTLYTTPHAPTKQFTASKDEVLPPGTTIIPSTELSTIKSTKLEVVTQMQSTEENKTNKLSTVPTKFTEHTTTERYISNVTEEMILEGLTLKTTESTKSSLSTISQQISETTSVYSQAPSHKATEEKTTIPYFSTTSDSEQVTKHAKTPLAQKTTHEQYEITTQSPSSKEIFTATENLKTDSTTQFLMTPVIPSSTTANAQTQSIPLAETVSYPSLVTESTFSTSQQVSTQTTDKYATLPTDLLFTRRESEKPSQTTIIEKTTSSIQEAKSATTTSKTYPTGEFAIRMFSTQEFTQTTPQTTISSSIPQLTSITKEPEVETKVSLNASEFTKPRFTTQATTSYMFETESERTEQSISTLAGKSDQTTQIVYETQSTETSSPETVVIPEVISIKNFTEITFNQTKEPCEFNNNCSFTNICWKSQCINPCLIGGTCASTAICSVFNHVTECTCPPGHLGDPKKECILKGITCTTRLKLTRTPTLRDILLKTFCTVT